MDTSFGIMTLLAVVGIAIVLGDSIDKLEARIDELYGIIDAMAVEIGFTIEKE